MSNYMVIRTHAGKCEEQKKLSITKAESVFFYENQTFAPILNAGVT